jgi:hypothetical protein
MQTNFEIQAPPINPTLTLPKGEGSQFPPSPSGKGLGGWGGIRKSIGALILQNEKLGAEELDELHNQRPQLSFHFRNHHLLLSGREVRENKVKSIRNIFYIFKLDTSYFILVEMTYFLF